MNFLKLPKFVSYAIHLFQMFKTLLSGPEENLNEHADDRWSVMCEEPDYDSRV